jgi:hypothetical protein
MNPVHILFFSRFVFTPSYRLSLWLMFGLFSSGCPTRACADCLSSPCSRCVFFIFEFPSSGQVNAVLCIAHWYMSIINIIIVI